MTRKRMTRFRRRAAFAFRGLFSLMIAAEAVMAQTGGGATLVGAVKDATGAVVAAAKVTVVNTATSFLTETTTSTNGDYYVPYLIPGDYRVKVSAAGFKEFVRDGITLRSAEVPRIDIVLELGSVSDSVTVHASASMLNTENVVSSYVLPADVLDCGRGCDGELSSIVERERSGPDTQRADCPATRSQSRRQVLAGSGA